MQNIIEKFAHKIIKLLMITKSSESAEEKRIIQGAIDTFESIVCTSSSVKLIIEVDLIKKLI